MSEPGANVPRGGLTYADYAALPDDGKRYQLVEGELVVTPSPTDRHQAVVLRLAARLDEHAVRHSLGEVRIAPLDVLLDEHVVLQPDVLFVSNARAAIRREAHVAGAPDLCIEVLSPGTERLDRVRKAGLYERYRVSYYWIVDPVALTVEEYVLEGNAYVLRSRAGDDDPFRSALFPGLELRLASVCLPESR
jgi:Uma2 family endonuclease